MCVRSFCCQMSDSGKIAGDCIHMVLPRRPVCNGSTSADKYLKMCFCCGKKVFVAMPFLHRLVWCEQLSMCRLVCDELWDFAAVLRHTLRCTYCKALEHGRSRDPTSDLVHCHVSGMTDPTLLVTHIPIASYLGHRLASVVSLQHPAIIGNISHNPRSSYLETW